MQNFPVNGSLSLRIFNLELIELTRSEEWLQLVALVVVSVSLLMLSRTQMGRVHFGDVRFRLVLIWLNRNPATMMVMMMIGNKNSCTLTLFVKILGFG